LAQVVLPNFSTMMSMSTRTLQGALPPGGRTT
jgi:hypothetical protein